MRKLLVTLLAGLALTTSLPALAGPYGDRHAREEHHFRPDYRDRPPHREHHHRHGAAWGVLGAGLALGAIALAVEAPRPVMVPTVPMGAVPIVVPPARPPVWYFCGSAGAYYPYVNYCPEGWRVVPATP